jgi:hypothetical protein
MKYEIWLAKVEDKLIDQLGEMPDAAYFDMFRKNYTVNDAVHWVMQDAMADAMAEFDF